MWGSYKNKIVPILQGCEGTGVLQNILPELLFENCDPVEYFNENTAESESAQERGEINQNSEIFTDPCGERSLVNCRSPCLHA